MIYPWLNIIAAMTYRDQVIGLYNELPWPRLSKDIKRFKELTENHTVIMGRQTFRSLNNQGLPNRSNIVLSNSLCDGHEYKIGGSNVSVIDQDIEAYLDGQDYALHPSCHWVIGGSQIYQQFLPYANKLYLTVINKKFYGDRFFPEIDLKVWERESLEKVEGDILPYRFEIWKRKNQIMKELFLLS